MLAGMDTNGMNRMTPGDRGPYKESSAWMVIGITLAVLLAIGGLVLVGAMVLSFIAMSRLGSNK
jgi:hypothetical protein